MSLTFIEVCAGCGGLSQGFIKSGFHPILLNEIDKTCCDTLRKNHPDVKIVNDDMTKLELSKYHGQVDVMMGGIPCQSFSHAGERKGLDDKRGDLILKFRNLLQDVEPKVFIIENVKGLTTHDKGETMQKVLRHFREIDMYNIVFKVLNAVDYEVPQKRERVIIVGVRKDLEKKYEFPKKTSKRLVLKDVLLDCPSSAGQKYPPAKEAVMKLVPAGGCWVDLPDDIQRKYMGKSMESGGGKRGMARRLSMDEACLTLTTSPCQKQTERCHPSETRPLTTREYARIQTFPDEYEFCGSVGKIYKQIGNAVPVMLAYHVAESVRSLLT